MIYFTMARTSNVRSVTRKKKTRQFPEGSFCGTPRCLACTQSNKKNEKHFHHYPTRTLTTAASDE